MRVVAAIVSLVSLVPLASAADRQKIGLVLEGGGALGFAHIGALQWFEEHRIPIDAIAGTSMGGLVGGLYATDESPQEIQALVQSINWDTFLRTQAPFDELSFRRKEDRLAFPNLLNFGWRGGIALPSGVNSGQEIDFILDRNLLPYFDVKSFDDLPIPFRCVATDLVSGREKDFDSGSLAAALRATVSIPAVFIPENRNGAVYTDGGSLNNLPVDLAKKMNVDIVIAVYLDEGPPAPNFQQSLVGIAGRTASIMIAANEMHNIQMADILLSADVHEFSTMDFSNNAKNIPRGYEAAERKKALLSRFSLAEEEWKSYLAQRRSRERKTAPIPAFVAVAGATPSEKSLLERSLAGQIGQPINPTMLEKKLTALSADGVYDSLRYGVIERSGQPGLGIFAAQKSNEPPFLDFGVTVDGSDTNDVRFGLAGRFTLLNLGGFESEWRNDVSVGETYGVGSEYYHPLAGLSHWFIAPHARAAKGLFDLYDNRNRTAEYALHQVEAGIDLGYALNNNAEIRLGEQFVRHDIDLKLGTPYSPDYARNWGNSSALFRYFGQDDAVVPHQGLSSQTRFDWFTASPFGTSYHSVSSKSTVFVPMSVNSSTWLLVDGGSAFGAKNLGLESFTLGGPFRLGAYGVNELIGNQYLLLEAGYLRKFAEFNPLLGGAVYGLAWIEVGKMYGDPLAPRVPMDGSIGIVTKTGLGPVFVGASMASPDRIKWWFGLGRVF